MNYPCTYFDIYSWNNEIVKMQSRQVPLIDILNDIPQKVTALKQDNKLVFEMVMSATESLNRKYFQLEKDSNGKEVLKLDSGNPVFIEGMSESGFKEDLNKLFTTKTQIIK